MNNRHQNTKILLPKLVRNCQKIKRGILPKNATTVEEINKCFEDETIMNVYGKTANKSDSRVFFKGAVERETHSFCVFCFGKNC